MALDPDVLPGIFPPLPDPDDNGKLRVAKIRLQVAVCALNEAIAEPDRRGAAFELALENIEAARRALVQG